MWWTDSSHRLKLSEMFERTWHKFAQCHSTLSDWGRECNGNHRHRKKGGLSFFSAWADMAGLHGTYSILMLQKVAHIALQSQEQCLIYCFSVKVIREGWGLEARSFWHGSLVYDSMICRQLFLERTAGTSPDSSVQFCVGPDPDAVVPSSPVSWLQNCPFHKFIEILEVNVRPCETCTARQGMYFTSSIILKILFSLKGATPTQLKLVDAKATFDAGLWCRPGESHRFHVDDMLFFFVSPGRWVYTMGDARFNAVTIN